MNLMRPIAAFTLQLPSFNCYAVCGFMCLCFIINPQSDNNWNLWFIVMLEPKRDDWDIQQVYLLRYRNEDFDDKFSHETLTQFVQIETSWNRQVADQTPRLI